MPLLTADEIARAVALLSWSVVDGELEKSVQRSSFSEALSFVNAVARLAEEMDHHPDIALRYDTVTLRLSTHYLGGITEADITLAQRIDALDR